VLRVQLVDRAPESWGALWEADPRATFFQHPRWMEAVTRGYPADRPLWLTAEEGGRAVGIVPLVRRRKWGLDQYLSMSFGTHGGPLVAAPDPGPVIAALAGGFRRLCVAPRVVRSEMTVLDPPVAVRAALAGSLGDWFQDFRTHLVDLTVGFDELWNHRYAKNTRNCVRMAERAGVAVGVERGGEAVEILCRFHAAQAEAWEGIQPHPREAVAGIVGALGSDARIYVARTEGGDPLAAVLNLEHGGREVHCWMSGSSPEARPLRAFHLLLSTAIREAAGRGFSSWDFGASGGNPKIEFFKASFGARPVPVLRCSRIAGWFRRLRKGPAWD
jgi:CelD/BcsL family acetyltransferase involved in cellulose biosynthesis